MEIFSILLLILEFIGITLLIILGILLFLIILVLFGAIRYYIFVEKKENLTVNIKISFIRIIKFVLLLNDNENTHYFKILFFKFFKKKLHNEPKNIEKTEELKKDVFEITENIEIEETEEFFQGTKAVDGTEKETKTETLEFDDKENIEKENNIFLKVKNIYDKFIYFKNYPDKKDILKYTLTFIKEIFFAIKPKKFDIDILIGFDDPADTGKFLGFIAIISEFLPFGIYSEGDFEKEIFEGNLETNGKTNVFKVGKPILKFIRKEPIWNIIKNRKG